ncbi:MAG: lytic transglycosylase domain-containing protein, partial [Muribaculaceae bacterium]|nr:lytic transglycosylase domain-containing protein [Muribaculaceae bacterium]
MKTSSLLASLLLMVTASVPAASAGRDILSIRDSLHEVPIVYPESFETNVRAMQENWYLRNYAEIDSMADSRAAVEVTDAELIERLGQLPTVIEMPFNSVVRNYIDMYATRRRQLVENMLGLGNYYMPIFEQALDRYGVPLELKYLPVIESALNPDAVSRAGATGLWQFMLPTATGEGLEVNSLVDQRRDPYSSSDAAARYLKKLHDIFGDWSLAIAAYNCGPGNVNKALR